MSLSQIAIIIALLSFMVVGFFVKKSSMKSYSDFTMNRGKLNWFTIATRGNLPDFWLSDNVSCGFIL